MWLKIPEEVKILYECMGVDIPNESNVSHDVR